MADLDAFYRRFLKTTLATRKARNPRYSVRAFARSLGIDNGFLSKLLAGKTLLSLDLAGKIVAKLRPEDRDRREFLLSAAEEQKCHALYLLDPELTDCDPREDARNRLPAPRARNKR